MRARSAVSDQGVWPSAVHAPCILSITTAQLAATRESTSMGLPSSKALRPSSLRPVNLRKAPLSINSLLITFRILLEKLPNNLVLPLHAFSSITVFTRRFALFGQTRKDIASPCVSLPTSSQLRSPIQPSLMVIFIIANFPSCLPGVFNA